MVADERVNGERASLRRLHHDRDRRSHGALQPRVLHAHAAQAAAHTIRRRNHHVQTRLVLLARSSRW